MDAYTVGSNDHLLSGIMLTLVLLRQLYQIYELIRELISKSCSTIANISIKMLMSSNESNDFILCVRRTQARWYITPLIREKATQEVMLGFLCYKSINWYN